MDALIAHAMYVFHALIPLLDTTPSRLDQLFPQTFSSLFHASSTPTPTPTSTSKSSSTSNLSSSKSKPSTPVTKTRRSKPLSSKDEHADRVGAAATTAQGEGFFGYFSQVLKQGLASVTGQQSDNDEWQHVDLKEEVRERWACVGWCDLAASHDVVCMLLLFDACMPTYCQAEKMKKQLERAEQARREKLRRQAQALTIDGKSELVKPDVLKKVSLGRRW